MKWEDLERSTKPLNWKRILDECSFTIDDLVTGKKTMIPPFKKMIRLLKEENK